MVVGELACGNMARRVDTLRVMNRLPHVSIASHLDALYLIEQHRLMGRGIGYVDVHLLASAAIDDATKLWTVDRRLRDAAVDLGLAYEPPANVGELPADA